MTDEAVRAVSSDARAASVSSDVSFCRGLASCAGVADSSVARRLVSRLRKSFHKNVPTTPRPINVRIREITFIAVLYSDCKGYALAYTTSEAAPDEEWLDCLARIGHADGSLASSVASSLFGATLR